MYLKFENVVKKQNYAMKELDDVKRSAERILEELSSLLADIELKEKYYVIEEKNIYRSDDKPKKKNFKEELRKNAPRMDEEGYIITEVGAWIEQ